MPSVREIASRAGVSISTVSRVLNNKGYVSEGMRRRVQETLRELEAAEAQGDKPLSIAFIHMPYVGAPFLNGIIEGIQASADDHQAQLRLISLPKMDGDTDIYRLPYFSKIALRPMGVILYIIDEYFPPIAKGLAELDIPFCAVAASPLDPAFSSVGPDDQGAGYRATSYLLNLGHSAIGFVGFGTGQYSRERIVGYEQALRESGIESKPTWKTADREAADMHRLLDEAPELTALLIADEVSAQQTLPALKERRSIPEDISVVMFDDTEFAETFDPPLTAVAFPLYDEGAYAVEMLIDQIRKPSLKRYCVTFEATLVYRESCTPPKEVTSG